MLRIKTITEPQGNKCDVTIEETDISSVPTGREWTLPFSTVTKDWEELKQRFKAKIAADNAKVIAITTLITEANNAKITVIS